MIKTYSQAKSIVESKFINSQYIKSRIVTGEVKYFPEEVEYWTKKIINGNLSESLFNSEFDLTYSSIQVQSQAKIRFDDYIGQTFLIDKNSFPSGLFLSSIQLFFATVDDSPVTLELRPLVNGYPSSTDIIPLSIVTTKPLVFQKNQVDTYNAGETPQNNSDSSLGTIFAFDFPVYLNYGYYCFVLKTNSSKHSVYVAERGQPDLITGTITTNPYVGSLVTSQQGVSWTIEQTKDLCFVLNRAKFEVGTKDFDLNMPQNIHPYNTINLKLKTQEFGEVSNIGNISSSVTNLDTLNQTTTKIIQNKNVNIDYPATMDISGGLTFNISLTNKTDALSPLIDLQKTGVILVNNSIDPFSQALSDSELLSSGGMASAKYVTKQIVLNDDFDADGLTVYIDSNKPVGTEIEIFYKVLNAYDFSKTFDDLNWSLLPRISQSQSATNTNIYSEETFQEFNITYQNDPGTIYTNFKYFAIKIVMYSNNSSLVPKLQNLRVIATV